MDQSTLDHVVTLCGGFGVCPLPEMTSSDFNDLLLNMGRGRWKMIKKISYHNFLSFFFLSGVGDKVYIGGSSSDPDTGNLQIIPRLGCPFLKVFATMGPTPSLTPAVITVNARGSPGTITFQNEFDYTLCIQPPSF